MRSGSSQKTHYGCAGTTGKCEGVYRRVKTLQASDSSPELRSSARADLLRNTRVLMTPVYQPVSNESSIRTMLLTKSAFVDSEGETGFGNYGGHEQLRAADVYLDYLVWRTMAFSPIAIQ